MEKTKLENHKFYVGDDLSQCYFENRPTYPPAVLDIILSYMMCGDRHSKHLQQLFDTAVDIACGSGQATVPLAQHFKRVVGCDVSQTQIKEAIHHNKCINVEYQISAAADMAFIPGESVALVTCATAFHHMDQEQVCQEVKRILCTNGVFAVYAYGLPSLANVKAQKVLEEYLAVFQSGYVGFGDVLNCYRDVKFPMNDVRRRDDLTLEWEVSLARFIGYLKTGYRYRNWMKEHGDSSDITQTLKERLLSVLPSEEGEDPLLCVSFPLFVLMGRKA